MLSKKKKVDKISKGIYCKNCSLCRVDIKYDFISDDSEYLCAYEMEWKGNFLEKNTPVYKYCCMERNKYNNCPTFEQKDYEKIKET